MRAPLAAITAVVACCVVLAACNNTSSDAPSARPQFALQDGAHNGGNPDFFFLPPMVGNPSGNPEFDPGQFNPGLAPTVVVCDWTTGCATPVAQFTTTSGTGSETIRVDTTGEQYVVNWHTDSSSPPLDATHAYRILVLVGKDTLGFADVDVVESGKELKNVQTGQYIGLLDGRTLPIKFRIENAALCNPPGTPPCASETVNVGPDAPEQILTLYTETGQPYAALRTNPQPGLDSGTTITFTLQPCDGFTGQGAAGYAKISDCLHITADPPIESLEEGGFNPKATVSICSLNIPYPAPEAAAMFRQEDGTGEIAELDHSDDDICASSGGAPRRSPLWHNGLPPIGNTPSMSSFEAAIPVGGAWLSTDTLPAPRRDHTATLLAYGSTQQVLIVGGTASGAELFDPGDGEPGSGTFSATGSPAFNHGQGASVTQLLADTALVVGGIGAPHGAEIYILRNGQFTALSDTTIARREYHSATRLADGRVLLAGGQYDTTGGPQTIADAEVYDRVTNTFTVTGSLNQDRSSHAAVLLPDGRVLIVGGTHTTTPGQGFCLNTAEIYDPSGGDNGSGSFTPLTDTMSVARCSPRAVLLSTGNVLIVGGDSPEADLFDPGSSTFSATGSMASRHASGTATLLADGRVLVAGGSTATGPVDTPAVEIYDPTSGVFTAVASMVTARQEFTATLLPDGRVLAVGGYSSTMEGDIALAEVFSAAPIIP
jgi:Galactose oxidase, central domain